MEKVCIVKRRQQYHQNDFNPVIHNNPFDTSRADFGNVTFLGQPFVEEFNDHTGHVVSITMTAEQSKMLQNSDYMRKLLDGTITDPALNLKLNADGRVVLNFSISEPYLRMLRCGQVCLMLQISRSFLQKLIHNKNIKSYKIGRLRRFVMEDILDYLINHEDYGFSNAAHVILGHY